MTLQMGHVLYCNGSEAHISSLVRVILEHKSGWSDTSYVLQKSCGVSCRWGVGPMLSLYNLNSLQYMIYTITGCCCMYLVITIISQSFLNPENCTFRMPLTLPIHSCEDHFCPAFSFLLWIMGYFGFCNVFSENCNYMWNISMSGNKIVLGFIACNLAVSGLCVFDLLQD